VKKFAKFAFIIPQTQIGVKLQNIKHLNS